MNIQAELISIGSELLNGRTQNTLGKLLGGILTVIGIELQRDTTIPDDIEVIQDTLEEALERTRMVFLSGGMGPTVDDVTREAVASFLGREIILDHETVKKITRLDAAKGHITNEAGKRQALIIEGCEILPNSAGAAPGQKLDTPDGKTIFLMPGPPKEFRSILEECVVPWLQGRFLDAQPKIIRTILAQNIKEADIVTLLENMEFEPWDVKLGFYPGDNKVEIVLTADQDKEIEIDEAEETLRSLLSRFVETEEHEAASIEEKVDLKSSILGDEKE